VDAQQDALLRNAQDAKTYRELFIHYLREGNMRRAEEYCQSRILLQPDDDRAYYDLGLIYRQEGTRDLALQAFHEALTLYPNLGDAHYYIADILAAQKKYADALTEYQVALQICNYTGAALGQSSAMG
jgi:tetratricopeptide (TPR) repeat protein